MRSDLNSRSFGNRSRAEWRVPAFKLVPNWPKPLPNGWRLGPVNGVAVDPGGRILVNNFVGVPPPGSMMATLMSGDPPGALPPPIVEFAPDGTFLRGWGGPGAGYDWPKLPHGIYIDHKGYVWIGGTWKGQDAQVLKFTRDGRFVMQIGRPGKSAGAASHDQLGRPAGFCVDPNANELFVADGYANRRIIVFDAETGAYKRMWGAYGAAPVDPGPDALDNFYNSDPVDPSGGAPRHFNSPVHCVVQAKDRQLYVCDRSNSRIQVFMPSGEFVREFLFDRGADGSGGQVTHVAFWPDRDQTFLIVGLLTDAHQIVVLRRRDGEIVSRSGRADEIAYLHMLGIDHNGSLFTGEVGRRVQKWTPVKASEVSRATAPKLTAMWPDPCPCCS